MRDRTPKELHMKSKESTIPNITDTLCKIIGGQKIMIYSDEDRAISHTYPNFSSCGLDVLLNCQSFTKSNAGLQILEDIENHLSGIEIEDRELREKIDQWYVGNLSYRMDNNNYEFEKYLKSKLKRMIDDEV